MQCGWSLRARWPANAYNMHSIIYSIIHYNIYNIYHGAGEEEAGLREHGGRLQRGPRPADRGRHALPLHLGRGLPGPRGSRCPADRGSSPGSLADMRFLFTYEASCASSSPRPREGPLRVWRLGCTPTPTQTHGRALSGPGGGDCRDGLAALLLHSWREGPLLECWREGPLRVWRQGLPSSPRALSPGRGGLLLCSWREGPLTDGRWAVPAVPAHCPSLHITARAVMCHGAIACAIAALGYAIASIIARHSSQSDVQWRNDGCGHWALPAVSAPSDHAHNWLPKQLTKRQEVLRDRWKGPAFGLNSSPARRPRPGPPRELSKPLREGRARPRLKSGRFRCVEASPGASTRA
jgi:hypothetical protein